MTADDVVTGRHLVRIGLGLLLGTAGYIVPFGAVAAVVLPARIAEIDPARKVVLVAVLAVGTAVAGLVGNVVFGALSDRTRVQWRGRLPWLVGGTIVAALLMVPVARASGVLEVLVWWFLAVAAINATTVTVMALLPDHVPRARRATLAGVAGIGNLLGTALGTALGATLLARPEVGVLTAAGLAVLLVAGASLAVAGLPTEPEPEPEHAASRSESITRDFYRAFAARLVLVLGYFMIHAYKLYIFTDYVGLDVDAAARALALTSVLFLATALVGSMVAGLVSDRRGRRRPLAIGCVAVFLVAAAVPLAVPTVAGMVAFSLVGGFSIGGFYAVDVALMSEVLPRARTRARDLGVLNVATTSGQVLGPATSSALLGLGQGYAALFVGAIVAGLLGIPFLAAIRTVR